MAVLDHKGRNISRSVRFLLFRFFFFFYIYFLSFLLENPVFKELCTGLGSGLRSRARASARAYSLLLLLLFFFRFVFTQQLFRAAPVLVYPSLSTSPPVDRTFRMEIWTGLRSSPARCFAWSSPCISSRSIIVHATTAAAVYFVFSADL